jgi:hypothetical protein
MSAEHKNAHEGEARPFCFGVVVWGETFRNFFLNYCIASLMAPNNVPALEGRRQVRFLIATTFADWEIMKRTAIFHTLELHADPVLLEIPPCPPNRPAWAHSIDGFKLCCDTAHRERAYLLLISPDYIFADGALIRLHQLAMQGVQAVLHNVQPRIAEEPFFTILNQKRLLPAAHARDTGRPLVCTNRELVSAALDSMHSMSLMNEWEAPCFSRSPTTPWWRVPAEHGIVIFSFYWSMLLIDMAAVLEHESSILEKGGTDGDYQMRTLRGMKKIYTVRDSDEVYIASWSPVAYQQCVPTRQWFGELGKGAFFRTCYYGHNLNLLHRMLLLIPTRLHSGSINEERWGLLERYALATILSWLDRLPPAAEWAPSFPLVDGHHIEKALAAAAHEFPWWRRNRVIWTLCREYLIPLILFLSFKAASLRVRLLAILLGARIAASRIVLVLRGDTKAREWLRWRLRKQQARLLRRRFHEAPPALPDKWPLITR